MSICDTQRQKVLNNYLLSPRCVTYRATKPKNQFYSWKNYLNADINMLFSKIRKCNASTSKCKIYSRNQEKFQDSHSRSGKEKNISGGLYNYEIADSKISAEYQQQNRNCYSKVEITNPIQKHKHSNSTFTGQRKDQVQIATSTVPSVEIEGLSSGSQGLDSPQYYSFTDTAQTKFISTFQTENRDEIIWEKETKTFRKTFENKFNFSEKPSRMRTESDQYHQQLKQEERLYLLKKFMEHYENIHHFKI